MQGRVGDGPGGVGACFVGGLLSMPVPSTHRSFRYSGSRPRSSGQTRTTTQTDSEADEEEDEDDEGEGGEEEEDEGSGDDSEPGWTPETHGGAGDGGGDEDHEMEGLEPEGVEEGVGEGGGVAAAAVEEASQHVVFDGYVYYWLHAESWPNIPKKGGKAKGRGAEGLSEAGIKGYMSKKLSEVELRQAIAKLVMTCDLPFKIVEAEAIAQIVEDTVVSWGLEGRCLGLTTDNASANIAAYRRLSEEGGGRAFFNSRLHFNRVWVGVVWG
ncbi:unnamed protein product [Closterium sp. Yama58-4]|nr:unnamed protein product [Closterium sp. Yama58-4]